MNNLNALGNPIKSLLERMKRPEVQSLTYDLLNKLDRDQLKDITKKYNIYENVEDKRKKKAYITAIKDYLNKSDVNNRKKKQKKKTTSHNPWIKKLKKILEELIDEHGKEVIKYLVIMLIQLLTRVKIK